MSSFKHYAKQAKQRLKNDFWDKVKEERDFYQILAKKDIVAAEGLLVKQKQQLKEKIYNTNFESDEEFYLKVKQLLSANDVIVNPIGIEKLQLEVYEYLADKSILTNMTESQKQAYLLKLSRRYQQAVEKFNSETETPKIG